MRWLVSMGLILALATAPRSAHGFARTISGHVDGGACLYWGPRTVHFQINQDGLADVDPAALTAAVEAGFGAWMGWSCSDFQYVDDGPTPLATVGYDRVLVSQPDLEADLANPHLVVFRQQACSDVVPEGDDCLASDNDDCDNKYGCWQDPADSNGDALAYTLVTSEIATGRILDADTAFDAWDFQFRDLATESCDAAVDIGHCADIQNTMAHEAGHFLGLAHSQNPDATMYFSEITSLETSKRDLTDDDVLGLCAIYPVGAPPVTCVPAREREVVGQGCGCANASGSLAALAALALLAVARRKRLH